MSTSAAANAWCGVFRRGVSNDTDRDLVFRFASSPEVKWQPRLHNLEKTKEFCQKHSFHVDSVCQWINYWFKRCEGLTDPPNWLEMRIQSRKRKFSKDYKGADNNNKVAAPAPAAAAAAAAAATATDAAGGDKDESACAAKEEEGKLEPPSSDDDVEPEPPEKKQHKSESLIELLHRIDTEEHKKLEEFHAKVDSEYKALVKLKENRAMRAKAYEQIKVHEAEIESIKRALQLPI